MTAQLNFQSLLSEVAALKHEIADLKQALLQNQPQLNGSGPPSGPAQVSQGPSSQVAAPEDADDDAELEEEEDQEVEEGVANKEDVGGSKCVDVRLNWGSGKLHSSCAGLPQSALDAAHSGWIRSTMRSSYGRGTSFTWLPSDWDIIMRTGMTKPSKNNEIYNRIVRVISPDGASFSAQKSAMKKAMALALRLQKRQSGGREEDKEESEDGGIQQRTARPRSGVKPYDSVRLCWGTGEVHHESAGVAREIVAAARDVWDRVRDKRHLSWLPATWDVLVRVYKKVEGDRGISYNYIWKFISPCGASFLRNVQSYEAAKLLASSQRRNGIFQEGTTPCCSSPPANDGGGVGCDVEGKDVPMTELLEEKEYESEKEEEETDEEESEGGSVQQRTARRPYRPGGLKSVNAVRLCWGTGDVHHESAEVAPEIVAAARATWDKERERILGWLPANWDVVVRVYKELGGKNQRRDIWKLISPCGASFLRNVQSYEAAKLLASSQRRNGIFQEGTTPCCSSPPANDGGGVGCDVEGKDVPMTELLEEKEYESEKGEEETDEEESEGGSVQQRTARRPYRSNIKTVNVRLCWGTGELHHESAGVARKIVAAARGTWVKARAGTLSWLPATWDVVVRVYKQLGGKRSNFIWKLISPCGASFRRDLKISYGKARDLANHQRRKGSFQDGAPYRSSSLVSDQEGVGCDVEGEDIPMTELLEELEESDGEVCQQEANPVSNAGEKRDLAAAVFIPKRKRNRKSAVVERYLKENDPGACWL